MGSLISKLIETLRQWSAMKTSAIDPDKFNLSQFLSTCGLENIRQLSNVKNIKICSGNQSCDMDSVASALSYSYYNYLYNNTLIIPVINIPKEDLHLRKDIVNLLQSLGIHVPSASAGNDEKCPLVFIEDIKQMKRVTKCSVDAVLVDHNEPQGIAKSVIDRVIGIIDHHADTKAYDKNLIESMGNPLIIESCGSNTSLVTRYWYPKIEHSINDALIKDVAKLSLAAGVLDTSNFKRKTEDPDFEALNVYNKVLGSDLDVKAFYRKVDSDKDDITGFNMYDLLRKDFKLFEFNGHRIGMSSLKRSINDMIQQFGVEDINKACSKYYLSNNMDSLMLLTNFSIGKKHIREVVFYSGDKTDLEKKIVSGIKDELYLKKIEDITDFNSFVQENSSFSRKQIAPAVEKALF